MKTRLIAVFLLIALTLTLCAACKDDSMLTDAEAQKIALEAAGLADAGISAHSHFGIHENVPQFEVHFSHESQEYTYIIHAKTGEILSDGK